MAMDVVDYRILGAEMQYVELELDPGEAAVGEAGSLFFMDDGISLDKPSKSDGWRLLRRLPRRFPARSWLWTCASSVAC